jgi:hypothetical protein
MCGDCSTVCQVLNRGHMEAGSPAHSGENADTCPWKVSCHPNPGEVLRGSLNLGWPSACNLSEVPYLPTIFFFGSAGIEPRTSYMLGECCITEVHPSLPTPLILGAFR